MSVMPKWRPRASRASLNSCIDLDPQLRIMRTSCSLFSASCPTVVILAFSRTIRARVESPSSEMSIASVFLRSPGSMTLATTTMLASLTSTRPSTSTTRRLRPSTTVPLFSVTFIAFSFFWFLFPVTAKMAVVMKRTGSFLSPFFKAQIIML